MIYKIMKNGAEINRIVADEPFIKAYCVENGYNYTPCPVTPPPAAPTAEERIAALEEAMLAMMGVTSDV